MLIDRPKVVEGSFISNASVDRGEVFPATANVGELFYLTVALDASTPAGLYSFGSAASWDNVGVPGQSFANHITNNARHLTIEQNVLLDGISPTLTAEQLNFVEGASAPIQEQLDAVVGDLATHAADQTIHITPTQRSLLDGLSPTLSSAELNFVDGATGNIQTQLNDRVTAAQAAEARLSDLEDVQVPAVQTNLDQHIANTDVHLTSAQNVLLDTIEANGILAADINKLSGAAGLSSSIPTLLTGLEADKLARSGGSMTGNLSMTGNSRITGLQSPIAADEPATKDYVDSFVQGLHWVGSVKAATIANISLNGTQVVDTVPLAVGDRVLVKNQDDPSQNGIYDVANGAWSRSSDANTALELEDSAVFVLEYAGASQSKSTWIQTASDLTLGTTGLSYSAFSGPVVNSAGNGIILGVNGQVSLKEGGGVTFDSNGALTIDISPVGGLMKTVDGTTIAGEAAAGAQLALTNTGVQAGTYSSGATTMNSFTVDANGRITSVGSPTVIAPAFSSITGTPTTLAGYGITNGVLKTGDTMTGSLAFSSGAVISNTAPAANTSWLSTAAYGISQGDNKTHFGFNNAGAMWNYIRGAQTQVDGALNVGGALTVADSPVWTQASLTNLNQLTNGPAYITLGSVTWGNLTGKPTRTNWATTDTSFVANQLGWKFYGANHTIFDASAGTSPTGSAVNNTNSAIAWSANYPSLMGFNGTETYGVRVDSARLSDLTSQRTFTNVRTDGVNRGSYGSISIAGTGGSYSGIDFTTVSQTLMVSGSSQGFFRNNATWDWRFDDGVLAVGTVPGARVSGAVDTATLATKASTVAQGGGNGTAMTFDYNGQNGQPTWLWGTMDGVTNRVWNPANFAVASATTAGSVPWTGVTGRPTLFYDFSQVGAASPAPNAFPPSTISGFDGVNTSDMGMYQVGLTVIGSGGGGVRSVQIAANWNSEELAPSGLRFRTNDDTSNTAAWSPFRTIWDQGNLTAVSQLSNDAGYTTVAASNAAYLSRANNTWITSADGYNRLYFSVNDRTYLSSGNGFQFRNQADAALFTIDASGNGTFAGDVSAYSDRRLKKDIELIPDALAKVEQLNGVTFTRRDNEQRSTGLIAQDVQEVLPEAVHTTEDGTLSVSYGNVIGLLVEAIKELKAEVADLKAKQNS